MGPGCVSTVLNQSTCPSLSQNQMHQLLKTQNMEWDWKTQDMKWSTLWLCSPSSWPSCLYSSLNLGPFLITRNGEKSPLLGVAIMWLCPLTSSVKREIDCLLSRPKAFFGQVILLLCEMVLFTGSRCWLHSKRDKVDFDVVWWFLGCTSGWCTSARWMNALNMLQKEPRPSRLLQECIPLEQKRKGWAKRSLYFQVSEKKLFSL